jgi:hypothetical protein
MSDTQLMVASNALGVVVVGLLIGYHYVTADSKKSD